MYLQNSTYIKQKYINHSFFWTNWGAQHFYILQFQMENEVSLTIFITASESYMANEKCV